MSTNPKMRELLGMPPLEATTKAPAEPVTEEALDEPQLEIGKPDAEASEGEDADTVAEGGDGPDAEGEDANAETPKPAAKRKG